MKKMLSVVLSALISIFALGNPLANSNLQTEPNRKQSLSASWTNSYHSLEEMREASELIILGTPISSKTEVRHDLVFTLFTVSINYAIKSNTQEKTIVVLQTGGTNGDLSTGFLEGAPALQIGKQYLLYLNYAETQNYGNYYLIAGANQGVAVVDNILTPTTNYTTDNEILPYNFSSNDIIESLSLTPYGSDDIILGNEFVNDTLSNPPLTTPCGDGCFNDFIWFADSDENIPLISYYLQDFNILGHTTDELLDAIETGIQSWNPISTHYIIRRVSQATGADMKLYFLDYGATGWDGITDIFYYVTLSDGTQEQRDTLSITEENEFGNFVDEDVSFPHAISHVTILLNYHSHSNSDLNFWQAVAAHEAGHMFGLNHHDPVNCGFSVSLMQPYTNNYYPLFSEPTAKDVTNVNYNYGTRLPNCNY